MFVCYKHSILFLLFFFAFVHQSNSQIEQIFFSESLVENIPPQDLEDFYYVKDSLLKEVFPLVRLRVNVSGKRKERLDDYYHKILEVANSYDLNAIRVDSSIIHEDNSCYLEVSLYKLNSVQIDKYSSDIDRNLIVVFGKFTKRNFKKKLKINGRKVTLNPFEYVKRYAPIGRRASVNMSFKRVEIEGKEDGIEYFVNGVKYDNVGIHFSFYYGGALGGLVIGANVSEKKPDLLSRGYGHYLMNIFNEKVVEAKSLQDLIDAKRKEWKEKNSNGK